MQNHRHCCFRRHVSASAIVLKGEARLVFSLCMHSPAIALAEISTPGSPKGAYGIGCGTCNSVLPCILHAGKLDGTERTVQSLIQHEQTEWKHKIFKPIPVQTRARVALVSFIPEHCCPQCLCSVLTHLPAPRVSFWTAHLCNAACCSAQRYIVLSAAGNLHGCSHHTRSYVRIWHRGCGGNQLLQMCQSSWDSG